MSDTDRTMRRSRTAMARTFLSRPVQRAIDDGILRSESTVFDYGCGRGGDVDRLASMGYTVSGWDPVHRPDREIAKAEVINIGYVVNVIEDPAERAAALKSAWGLAIETLVVSARLDWDARGITSQAHLDGVVTDHRTFQKFFRQEELRAWIDSTLGCESVAAEPGIFYVFRDPVAQERMLAHRSRSRGSKGAAAELWYRQNKELLEPLETFIEQNDELPNATDIDTAAEIVATFGSIRNAFHAVKRATPPDRWVNVELPPSRTTTKRFEQNIETLTPLLNFLTDRGRIPRPTEVAGSEAIEEEFGSIRAAYSLVRKVTGSGQWEEAERRARRDVLVYLALGALRGRPRLSDLPDDTQYDVKDFFGSYKTATALADDVLFATGDSGALLQAMDGAPFGKHTPEAYYVHAAGLADLDPILRVYAGCARVLTGEIPQANILKMHKIKPQVSFLIYPQFDRKGHPELLGSIVSRLGRLHVDYRSFAESDNPPILHRKELFVPTSYPGREKFARLTAAEERRGLLSQPTIGTRDGWEQALAEASLTVRGHRLTSIGG